MKLPIGRKHIPLAATGVVLLALYAAACLAYEGFFSLPVAVNFLRDWSFVGIMAMGMTFVILSGGIDLSVGSVLAFTTIFTAKMIEIHGMHPVEAWVLGLGIGAAFGAGMGFLIHYYELPPFLVTLGGMFFARGMAFVVFKEPIGLKNSAFIRVADFGIDLPARGFLPSSALIFLALFVVSLYIAHSTRWGRNVYAIGGNEQSALLMGLPVARTKVLVYALNGFCSALAGIVYTLYLPTGDPNGGWGAELDVIAAVVIGGTLLTGGVGYIGGTMMGVLILAVIDQALKFQGNLSAWWLRIAMGVLLLIFISIQRLISGTSAQTKR